MTAHQEHETQAAGIDSTSKTTLEKVRAEAKVAQARVKAEEKARQKAEKALDECQEDLKVLQAELDRERQRRSKAEEGLAEAKRAIQVEAELAELLPAEPGMEPSEPVVPPTPLSTSAQAKKPSPPMQPAHLTISEVQVFRRGEQGGLVLKFSSDESMIIQTRFQIHGPGAAHLSAEGYPYEIKVYAGEVTNRPASLLASHRAKLVKDTVEYTDQMMVYIQPPGLYRPLIMVVLNTPVKMLGQRKGPVILVVEK